MAKMRKIDLAKYRALYKTLNAAQSAVFAVVAPRRDVVFGECLKLASADQVKAYQDASRALRDFESELISAGRAWHSPSGVLCGNGVGAFGLFDY